MVTIVVLEDAVHRGNDDVRTNDLFRIARKEAVRLGVHVRRIAFSLFIAFTRLALSRTK